MSLTLGALSALQASSFLMGLCQFAVMYTTGSPTPDSAANLLCHHTNLGGLVTRDAVQPKIQLKLQGCHFQQLWMDGWMPSDCSHLLIKRKERKRITSNVLTKIHCLVLVCLHMIKKEAQCKLGSGKGSRRQSTEQNMGQQDDTRKTN